ncbi:hypothetical protein BC829DRAFT_419694 [Chytridium lagenaria]|nr:hypothetical protein BC829DRAFT_419694 [Chytridium lagenaria]
MWTLKLTAIVAALVAITISTATANANNPPHPLEKRQTSSSSRWDQLDRLHPCYSLDPRANRTYFTYEQGQRCQNRIDRNIEQIRTATIDIGLVYLDMHASLPYFQQSTGIDLANELRAIRDDTSIRTTVDLERRLDTLSVRFGTRAFVASLTCRPIMQVWQPIVLAAKPSQAADALGEVFVGGTLVEFSQLQSSGVVKEYFDNFWRERLPNANFEKYKGFLVESINGQKPWDMARSLSSNQNYAFAYPTFGEILGVAPGFISQGSPSYEYDYYRNPVTYTLRDPSSNALNEITFPWMATTTEPKNSMFSFEEILSGCMDTSTLSKNVLDPEDPKLVRPPTVLERFSAFPASMIEGNSTFAFKVDNTTAAVVMNRFFWDPDFDKMDRELASIVRETPSVKNLIIDLTNMNTACDQYVMLEYLFPNATRPLQYNYRLTQNMEQLLRSTAGPIRTTFLNVTQMDPLTPGNILLDEITNTTVGGSTERFSRKFTRRRCTDYVNLIVPGLKVLPRNTFTPQNVVMVSDQNCVQGCNEFVRIASDQLKIKTISYRPYASDGSLPVTANRYFQEVRSFLRNIVAANASTFPSERLREIDFFATWRFPSVNTFDPDTPANAIPLNLNNASMPDITIGGVAFGGDWPMGVWRRTVKVMGWGPGTPPVAGGSGSSKSGAYGGERRGKMAVIGAVLVYVFFNPLITAVTRH